MPGQGIFHYFKRLVQVTDSVDRTARSRLRLEEQTNKKLVQVTENTQFQFSLIIQLTKGHTFQTM